MNERPILFSAPMVRAILDGRKTMTRRVMKPQPEDYPYHHGLAVYRVAKKCPYGQPGDLLWVRETWAAPHAYDHLPPRMIPQHATIHYAATEERGGLLWRPSIHMPRWASRITLEITGVRVERLQDITEEDAEAEGVRGMEREMAGGTDKLDPDSGLEHGMHCSPKLTFSFLWDHLNYDRGFGWYANPWVWVVEFEKVGATDCAERNG